MLYVETWKSKYNFYIILVYTAFVDIIYLH